MSDNPNAAVVTTAQAAASDVGAAVQSAASSVANAVEADAQRLAVKDETKAETWIDREWEAIKAKMHAALAEAEAYFKAHV